MLRGDECGQLLLSRSARYGISPVHKANALLNAMRYKVSNALERLCGIAPEPSDCLPARKVCKILLDKDDFIRPPDHKAQAIFWAALGAISSATLACIITQNASAGSLLPADTGKLICLHHAHQSDFLYQFVVSALSATWRGVSLFF